MNKKIFYFVLLIMSLGFFSACSDDDDEVIPTPDYATEVSGTYKGDLNVKIPSLEVEQKSLQKILLSKSEDGKVKLELRNFSFAIGENNDMDLGNIIVDKVPVSKDGETYKLSETKIKDYKLTELITADIAVSGTITGKKADLKIDVTNATAVDVVNVTFSGDKMDADNEKTEALITKMTIASDLITEQPVIDGTNIIFYLTESATADNLKALVPTIEISEKAKVNPESGKAVDFSGNNVKFTVTAEDGIHKTVYTVTWANKKVYGFEEWTKSESSHENLIYSIPTGWATCNPAVELIKGFFSSLYSGDYPVKETTLSHSGKYALEMTTLDTKGNKTVPKVTAATAFWGTFNAFKGLINPSETTEFGIPFTKKPLKVKGFYKYKAGDKYYDKTEEVTNVKDQFTISAVLYEVGDYKETLNGSNINDEKEAKIIARADLHNGDEKSEFTPFELVLNYKKNYDSTKKYKFAVIFSSSKDGADYKGAPGSTLIVDDVEIISE